MLNLKCIVHAVLLTELELRGLKAEVLPVVTDCCDISFAFVSACNIYICIFSIRQMLLTKATYSKHSKQLWEKSESAQGPNGGYLETF